VAVQSIEEATLSGAAGDGGPPVRVLHVHRIAGIGGSERHLLTLMPALARAGLEVAFLGLDVPGSDADRFYAAMGPGVRVLRLPCPRDLDPALALRVVRAARRLRPDLVHTHLVHGDVYGALAAAACGAALVSSKHNDDPFRTGPFRHVDRLLAARARRIIAISDALGRFEVERCGLPASRLEVVHYGMDAPAAAWATSAPPDVPAGARLLLALGRLTGQKGHDTLLRALPAVRRAHPDVVVALVGDGPLEGRMRALAAELGVADAVLLPGRTGDVTAWLRRAEALVHPSRWEGFGLVLLEAMLAERPVVASRVSAIPEIVADGATGLLVPPDDVAALTGALLQLLGDPPWAAAMGRAGRARARDEFSVARMVARTRDVYRAALSPEVPPPAP
jgi:glycosyltransferase involved in cell wall biosynthesis